MSKVFKFQSTPPFVRRVPLDDPWLWSDLCVECKWHLSDPWVSLCEWCQEAHDQAKK